MLNYTEIPKDMKLADIKFVFATIYHILKRGYIDSFGVVKGESKNPAFAAIFNIRNENITKYFSGTLIDFDDAYDVIKSAKNKSDLLFGMDSDNRIVSIKHVDSEHESPFVKVGINNDIYFDVYDNPHVFKLKEETIHQFILEEFVGAIVNNYVYRENHYVITKEAIPKPKKLLNAYYAVSDYDKKDDCEYMYFTTYLSYPLLDARIASQCLILD